MKLESSEVDAPPILKDVGLLGRELTRRTALKGGASIAAGLGLGALWPSTAKAAIGGPGGLVPRSDLLMLVNRLSQGFTQAEMSSATSLGYSGYLASVLAGPASDPVGDAYLLNMQPMLGWSPYEMLTLGAPGLFGDPYLLFAQQATVGLSVVSSKILLERTMDLWSNRLSVYGKKPLNGAVKMYADYHIFRPNALGTAAGLLTAFARDTSALYYLDNVASSTPAANENWAREFLELYSMGQIDQSSGAVNYVEADVQAAAQAFTGWSWETNLASPNLGLFTYLPSMHISGPKTFQGVLLTPDNATSGEGDQVVSIVTSGSSMAKTANGIAYKMLRHFLRYDPRPSQILSVAAQYSAGIPAMIGTCLTQSWVSGLMPSSYLFSSPSRFVYQALRASGASPQWDKTGVLEELRRMGNAPFEWPAPDGYPDEPEKWGGGLFSRWEFANKLFTPPDPATGDNPELPGVVFTDAQILAMVQPYVTILDIINNVDQRFTGGVLSDNEKSVLEAYVTIAVGTLPPMQVLRELLALTISTPTFQYY